jgi:hypothetical protein
MERVFARIGLAKTGAKREIASRACAKRVVSIVDKERRLQKEQRRIETVGLSFRSKILGYNFCIQGQLLASFLTVALLQMLLSHDYFAVFSVTLL